MVHLACLVGVLGLACLASAAKLVHPCEAQQRLRGVRGVKADPASNAAAAEANAAEQNRKLQFGSMNTVEECGGKDVSFKGEGRASIFDQLSSEEIHSVGAFLLKKGLVDFEFAGLMDSKMDEDTSTFTQIYNFVNTYQFLSPNKKAASAYLSGESNVKPERFAKVTVYRGRPEERDVMQYKVGPLPVNGDTKATEMLVPKEWPWGRRAEHYVSESHQYAPRVLAAFDVVSSVIDGLGYTGIGGGDDDEFYGTFSYWAHPSLASTVTDRITTVHFMNLPPMGVGDAQGGTLLAIPLSFDVHENPDAPAMDWVVDNVEYCFQAFSTIESLALAQTSGTVKHCDTSIDEFTWTQMAADKPFRATSEVEMPRIYEPEGHRFAIEGNNIEWMGWEFHIGADDLHGARLHAVKFGGELIAYELAVMEYFASYSGVGSTHQVFYHDSQWRIGGDMTSLQVGLDCPSTAKFVDIVSQVSEDGPETTTGAFCIFEQPLGTSLYRHYNAFPSASGDVGVYGSPKSQLVVRSITTPGNYDYIQEWVFQLDGRIDVELKFGGKFRVGYMMDSYGSGNGAEDNEDYIGRMGVPVNKHSNGLLHDHIAGFKVDLDIAGTKNTLQTTKIKYGTYLEATGKPKPDYAFFDGIKYGEVHNVTTEAGFFAMDYDFFTLVNPTEKNAWGVPRGYEVAFGPTKQRQVMPDDHPIMSAGHWMKYNLCATLHKDEEELGAVPSNFNIGVPPPKMYDMDEFRNGEGVEGEDVVLWVALFKQHWPKAEDVPVVSNFGTFFSLVPRNFHDRAAFKDLPDGPSTNYGLDMKECTPTM
ncbi:copper amine oxidase [Pelagophyceae sp. CCMP2097]|nr:copper amine oxidase [Pelagophyceae sp. CCMP2097]